MLNCDCMVRPLTMPMWTVSKRDWPRGTLMVGSVLMGRQSRGAPLQPRVGCHM